MARTAHCSGRRPAKIMSPEPALTRCPATMPCRPDPADSLACRGICSGKPRASAACHDGGGQNVLRSLLEAGAEPQHLVGALARCGLDREQAGAADGERSGLVEQHGVRPRQLLDRSAALDQNAAPGRAGDAGDEGDRCRQNQRTGRGRDQHREAAHRIARQEPRDARHHQRQRQEQERITIGEPHERSLGGLRRRHQPHDARIGAFTCDRRCRHLEGFTDIQRAARAPARPRL